MASTTTTADLASPAAHGGDDNYLTHDKGLASWLLTRDHKRIALLFFASITFFFFVGGAAATLMRMNLATPEGLLQPALYNRMFTMHGIIMVWFFLIPSIPATFGNFFIPMMIGAHDLAFPLPELIRECAADSGQFGIEILEFAIPGAIDERAVHIICEVITGRALCFPVARNLFMRG